LPNDLWSADYCTRIGRWT